MRTFILLTKERVAILDFIRQFKADNQGNSPSFREIMEACDFTSTSVVAFHMRILREHKLVDYQPGIPRSIILNQGGDYMVASPS